LVQKPPPSQDGVPKGKGGNRKKKKEKRAINGFEQGRAWDPGGGGKSLASCEKKTQEKKKTLTNLQKSAPPGNENRERGG